MSASDALLPVIALHSGIPFAELQRMLQVLSAAAPTLAAREQEIRESLIDHRDFTPEDAAARIKHLAIIGAEGLTDVKRKELEFAQLHQPLREIRKAVIAAAISVGSDIAPPAMPAVDFSTSTTTPVKAAAATSPAPLAAPPVTASPATPASVVAAPERPAAVTPVGGSGVVPVATAPVASAPSADPVPSAPAPAPSSTATATAAVAAADAAMLKVTSQWAGHCGAIESLLLIPAARMPAPIREAHPTCPLFLASGGEDKEINVFSMETHALVLKLAGHTKTVRAMVMLRDGRLASACNDGIIRIFNLSKPTEVATLAGHAGFVTCLLVTRSGVLASAGEDRTIRFWDVESLSPLSTFTGHSHVILSMALLGDGSRMASGDCDGRIRIWDVADGSCLQTLTQHKGWVTGLLSLPDGRFVSSSCDKTLRVWTLDESAVLSDELRGHTQQIYGLALLEDGSIVSGGYDKKVRVWDVYTMKCKQVLDFAGVGQYAIAALPTGGFVSAGGSASSPSAFGGKPAVPAAGTGTPSYPITVVTRS